MKIKLIQLNKELQQALEFHPELDYLCQLNKLVKRINAKGIVIHHAASDGSTPQSVTRYHTQSRGWYHAGYHILITPDGKAHALRSLDTIGAHAGVGARPNKPSYNNNRETIGIALTGAIHEHKHTEEAVSKLLEVIALLANTYKDLEYIEGHNKMPGCATACPGRFMPMDNIKLSLSRY